MHGWSPADSAPAGVLSPVPGRDDREPYEVLEGEVGLLRWWDGAPRA